MFPSILRVPCFLLLALLLVSCAPAVSVPTPVLVYRDIPAELTAACARPALPDQASDQQIAGLLLDQDDTITCDETHLDAIRKLQATK